MVQIVFLNGNDLDTLDLDAALQFAETHTAQVTEHPVETGATVSDHVILRPKTLRIEGIITATPLPTPATAKDFGWEPFSNDLVDIEGQGTISPDRFAPHDAKELLRRIHAAKLPVTIGKGLGDPQGLASDFHENMVLETLEMPEDGTTGEALRFTGSFKEMRTVESETVPLAKSPKPGTEHKGHQATKIADAPTAAQASVYHQLIHGLYGEGQLPLAKLLGATP